jgi:hypothetical protein
MGADPGQAAFAFLASREGPFDDPADFFPLPRTLAVRPSRGNLSSSIEPNPIPKPLTFRLARPARPKPVPLRNR